MAGGTADSVPVVVSGGTGFVGRRFLRVLAAEPSPPHATVLGRGVDRWQQDVTIPWPPSWDRVESDLGAPGLLDSSAWPQGATVVHLAAATGRASPRAMREVNVEGTRRMLDAARERQARNFIFVSSVAVGFENRRWYHYASAKSEAEALVRSSGVPWTIVRPTMVFGPGSPNEEALRRLACGPVPVVPGSGRVLVQPVHVNELARVLVFLTGRAPLLGVLEVGGRDVVSMGDLLGAMRRGRGLPPRRLWPVPLGAVRTALGFLEPVLQPWFPVSAGQLSAFVNDSVAASSPTGILEQIPGERRGLADMLAEGAAEHA